MHKRLFAGSLPVGKEKIEDAYDIMCKNPNLMLELTVYQYLF